MPYHQLIIGVVQKAIELAGPIVLREINRPRTRKFVEDFAKDQVRDLAVSLRNQFQGTKKKSQKDFIIRRGNRRFHCRKVN